MATDMRRLRPYPLLVLFLLLNATCACSKADVRLDLIKLPPGFRIALFTDKLPGARSLAVSPSGTIFVGTRDQGKVYAAIDTDHDHTADRVVTIATGLNMPNGVAFRDGALYVAEINRILRYNDIEAHLAAPPSPEVVFDGLPADEHHGWKFIRFGPDGRLYIPIGAPCNICDPGDPYAAIHRLSADGSKLELYARGVRNTVGFDWDPETGDLWFTDNGRDWLGDDKPPDELNHATEPGLHFGYPYWHGKDIPDPEFGGKMERDRFTPPAMELGAHVAPLGMRFYTGTMFPTEYHNQILIPEHGSWNRSTPIGYRISLVRLQEGKAVSYEVFASGWLQQKKAWGRPVDLEVMADGSLLVSDDRAGALYRITYEK